MATCQDCGARIGLLARRCLYCGEPNSALRTLAAVTLTVLLLAGAAALAFYVATREEPLIRAASPVPADAGTAAGSSDYAWLEAAMKQCDAQAERERDVLHFLIIPLLLQDRSQAEDLRSKALNVIGNATILTGDDMLAALRSGTLAIFQRPYVFTIRDEANQEMFRWEAATGVKWLTSKSAAGVQRFSMQVMPPDGPGGDAWGNPIDRQPGNCYWINAVTNP